MEWRSFSHLEEPFNIWLRADKFPRDFDSMPTAWQDIITFLCGYEVATRLRAYETVGSLSSK